MSDSDPDPDPPYLFGYEWAFHCECGQGIDLSGQIALGHKASEEGRRRRRLENGDTITCPNEDCDRSYELNLTPVSPSDDSERGCQPSN